MPAFSHRPGGGRCINEHARLGVVAVVGHWVQVLPLQFLA